MSSATHRAGIVHRDLKPSGAFGRGELSRDGHRHKLAAIVGDSSGADVWIVQVGRGTVSRATFENLPLVRPEARSGGNAHRFSISAVQFSTTVIGGGVSSWVD